MLGCRGFVVVRLNGICRNDEVQEIDTCGTDPGLSDESSGLWRRKRYITRNGQVFPADCVIQMPSDIYLG